MKSIEELIKNIIDCPSVAGYEALQNILRQRGTQELIPYIGDSDSDIRCFFHLIKILNEKLIDSDKALLVYNNIDLNNINSHGFLIMQFAGEIWYEKFNNLLNDNYFDTLKIDEGMDYITKTKNAYKESLKLCPVNPKVESEVASLDEKVKDFGERARQFVIMSIAKPAVVMDSSIYPFIYGQVVGDNIPVDANNFDDNVDPLVFFPALKSNIINCKGNIRNIDHHLATSYIKNDLNCNSLVELVQAATGKSMKFALVNYLMRINANPDCYYNEESLKKVFQSQCDFDNILSLMGEKIKAFKDSIENVPYMNQFLGALISEKSVTRSVQSTGGQGTCVRKTPTTRKKQPANTTGIAQTVYHPASFFQVSPTPEPVYNNSYSNWTFPS